jgi:hypothetical protein
MSVNNTVSVGSVILVGVSSFIITICVAIIIVAIIALLIQMCMSFGGTGWMQIFGYSWEYDYGSALGGTYDANLTPDKLPKFKIYYKDGINFTYVLFYSIFGSIFLGGITAIISGAILGIEDKTKK